MYRAMKVQEFRRAAMTRLSCSRINNSGSLAIFAAILPARSHMSRKNPIDGHTLSDGDGGCHVKVRAPDSGGFNGATRLPLCHRDAPNGYRIGAWWRHRNSHLSMPRLQS